jgi:hypothetical protein
MFLPVYREPPSGWQGCKEKLLRKSPCIILHFVGILLSSQHHKYHNIRQNVTIIFGTVSTYAKNGIKIIGIKSSILVLPGGSVDSGQRCPALGVALFYFL